MLEKLKEFGLSPNEAKVYLALLELGSSSVTEIARRAKVTRTNAYHLLNALLTYGLVSTNENQSKVTFSAEKPERLLYMVRDRLNKAEKAYKEAEELMPELRSIYHDPEQKLRVRYYEGVEGIITAYEDTLRARNKKILGYASVEDQHSFFPGYFPEYYERRTDLGIRVECILAETDDSLRIKSLDKSHIRTSMIVPESYKISPEINIYDDKVAIMSLKEKFGVIIESREVTDAFKKLFKLAYEKAEEYDKSIIARLKAQKNSSKKN